MLRFFYIAIFTFVVNSAYAQLNKSQLQQVLESSLRYLEEVQVKKTVNDSIFEGEWPSTMGLKNGFLYLGKAYPYRDSNCFTQANIYNLLAEMYLADTSLISIRSMLSKATLELISYQDSLEFNFWKKLEPNIPLSRKGPHPEDYLAHRPTNFQLKTRFINNAADIANDADDTSTGNLALYYHNLIFDEKRQIASQKTFDLYIDRNRNNYHWFNFIHKLPKESGAYMTWLAPEVYFKHWNFPWQVAHNLVFFLPGSSCFPHPYTPYVPWGSNDIDAVVNCNVLYYLAKTGQIESAAGKDGVVRVLKHVVKKERWSRAGIYYPNRYYIHYTFSKTLPYLQKELKNESLEVLDHLIASQNEDGSYSSRRKVNKKDILQSTVYALQALLNFKKLGLDVPDQTIEAALNFLVSHQREDDDKTSWEGGVFFSGGTVVRNVLYFKSDAYTTALVAQSIQKYLALFDSQL
ncbi:hypothetical protein [Jiulongibacter sp. NS-SX5]|uniref:hypothetical protein n=1 Tax=Jiulongibacter sp. NS-SX5 TaxID=3463854 RepID=UPI0040591F13